MNDPHAALPADADAAADARHRRLRFELIFTSVCLAAGLFLLPVSIYVVGTTLLGPYGAGDGAQAGSLGSFFGDFFGDLAQPSGRSWAIVLGPLLLMSLVRVVFIGLPRERIENAAGQQSPPPPSRPVDHRSQTSRPARTERPLRVEPRIGSDPE